MTVVLITLWGLAVLSSFATGWAQSNAQKKEEKEATKQQKRVILTTTDLKQEYEIVGIVFHYQEFPSFAFRGDPLEISVDKGMKAFEEKVSKLGADAVIGLRISFANRTEKDEGRVLVYGTAVKFK